MGVKTRMAALASAPPSCAPGRSCGRARCQMPADFCEHWRVCDMVSAMMPAISILARSSACFSIGPTDKKHKLRYGRRTKENKTQTSLRAAWSPNVVRHHLALRAQPLQPPLRRQLRHSQRGRTLLVAHASGCHLFNGDEFPVRSGPFRTQNDCKQLGFESDEAVVHG